MPTKNSFLLKCLRWVQRLFVHTNVVPQDPFADLNIDADRPIVYVMKTESISDMAVLSDVTKKFNLVSPYTALELDDVIVPRVITLEGAKPLFGKRKETSFLRSFTILLNLHKNNPQLDVQLVPISMFWGRTPGKADDTMRAAVFERENPTWLRKVWMILFLGKYNFVQFSNAVSLQFMAQEHGADKTIAHKLSRVARVHFRRQRKVMTGPTLPNRQALFSELLNSPNIQKAIHDEMANKNLTEPKARDLAESYLNEIAANYSDSLVRISERILTWLWNKLYKGINIKGAEQIRQLHHDGHEIVYVPCHRSHIDYLLLSYILYYEGMVPPHIAAGINLNFWPAGPLFRRGGAFFIRRSFNGNKLYTAVFKEYLDQLFAKGYSVEYFTEGGRSRTGRLLSPKTGMLAMTVNSVLRGIERPVTLVPVYLGYDHVMEVGSYHKELSGKKKKKESVWQVFGAIGKLRNFGEGYVNFGQPITLQNYLTEVEPDWRQEIAADPDGKPQWLTPAVNTLANRVMTRINDAAAVSAVTLTSLVLLSSEQNALERSYLENQLDFYLELLKRVPYTTYVSVAEGDGKELLQKGLDLEKFTLQTDDFGDIVMIDDKSEVTMTYYRNNIIHLFMVPSLLANCLVYKENCTREQALSILSGFYPLLQAELFMSEQNLTDYANQLFDLYLEKGLVQESEDGFQLQESGKNSLSLLAETMSETLQRYAIIFNLLAINPDMERGELERESHRLATRLGSLHGITAPEFYDKKLYGALSVKLKGMGYFACEGVERNICQLRDYVNQLLRPQVKQTIVASVTAERDING